MWLSKLLSESTINNVSIHSESPLIYWQCIRLQGVTNPCRVASLNRPCWKQLGLLTPSGQGPSRAAHFNSCPQVEATESLHQTHFYLLIVSLVWRSGPNMIRLYLIFVASQELCCRCVRTQEIGNETVSLGGDGTITMTSIPALWRLDRIGKWAKTEKWQTRRKLIGIWQSKMLSVHVLLNIHVVSISVISIIVGILQSLKLWCISIVSHQTSWCAMCRVRYTICRSPLGNFWNSKGFLGPSFETNDSP